LHLAATLQDATVVYPVMTAEKRNVTEGGGTSVYVHDQTGSAVRTKWSMALYKFSRYFSSL